jgi:hypothetical protein
MDSNEIVERANLPQSTVTVERTKMSHDPKDYPPNWKAIVAEIRLRSGGRCECTGECGLHRDHPGPRRCVEKHGELAVWAKGKVVLTTAHLCHKKKCDDRRHLKAMCNRCHLRYDRHLHAAHRRERRERETGQLSFARKKGHQ